MNQGIPTELANSTVEHLPWNNAPIDVVTTVRPTVGAIPTPSGERGNSMTPTVATGHQSVKRGQTWCNTESDGAKLPADVAMATKETHARNADIMNQPTRINRLGVPKGHDCGHLDRYTGGVHPTRNHGAECEPTATQLWTDGTGKLSRRLSLEVDQRAGDQAASPERRRIAQEANAGGNAPDMQTWAR